MKFTNLFQVTESTVPTYFPYLDGENYTIFGPNEEVRANLVKEGVTHNDYLTRFRVEADSVNSAWRYNFYSTDNPGVLAIPQPVIRLNSLPTKGTLSRADTGAEIVPGAVLPQGTFAYTNTNLLDGGGDSFIYEVEVTAGGAVLRLRARAAIYQGTDHLLGTTVTNTLDGVPMLGWLNSNKAPINAQFQQVLGMGGGSGSTHLIWDAFKAAGARNLVVISSGGTYAGLQNYLLDIIQSRYAPFDRVDAFFISTEEQADSPAIREALSRRDAQGNLIPTAVYFTGGDQTEYLDLFGGTNPATSFIPTINRMFAAKQLSFGGSSAGLAVQGSRAFRGPVNNSTGSRLLLEENNVYSAKSFGRYVNFNGPFLDLSSMLGSSVVTETHFKERNRMPRFVAMLAQAQSEAAVGVKVHGVAVDEGTAVIVREVIENGVAKKIGVVVAYVRRATDLPGYAFFGEAPLGTAVRFQRALINTTRPIVLQRVGVGQIFDFSTWSPWWTPNFIPPSNNPFTIEIDEGRVRSTGLTFATDLYYEMSTVDLRLLVKQTRDGNLII